MLKFILRGTPSGTANSTIAIQSTDGLVQRILWNDFFDVKIGVEYLNTDGVPGFYNVIGAPGAENTFENNAIAIHTVGSNYLNILSNVISNPSPPSATTVGILNEYSRPAVIRDNNPIDGYTIGIDVVESSNYPSLNTLIWFNTITNSDNGMLSKGRNQWTRWNCNEMDVYANSAFKIDDYLTYMANIQPHGVCGTSNDLPAGNKFDQLSPDPIDDIENVTAGSLNFQYVFSSANAGTAFEPDEYTVTNVTVTPCPTAMDDDDFCAGLPPSFTRDIADILAQRDTLDADDTLTIGLVNLEAMLYYLDSNDLDSALWYLANYGFSYDRKLLSIPFLMATGQYEEIQAIVDYMPTGTEDEQDIVDYYNLILTLAKEERDYFDMDVTELELIAELSEKQTETGRKAQIVMGILYGTPLEIPCEMTSTCEERLAHHQNYQHKLNSKTEITGLLNKPNPFSEVTSIIIPAELWQTPIKFGVYDCMGRIVMQKNIPLHSSEVKVDARELTNGVYSYSFSYNGTVSATGRMTVIK